MNISQFNSLSGEEQTAITWEQGILEAYEENNGKYFILYKVGEFYVEIASDSETNEVLAVRSFGLVFNVTGYELCVMSY
ncbi:MAG: hypothetical protein H7Y42_12125 [Chitinophagaceae bacterium]|nr:hypothetical protein [Chitinophagaceae bacterium]